MSASATTQGDGSGLLFLVLVSVIVLGGLVSALSKIPASAPKAPNTSPPVQQAPVQDWGALEAEGIACYYATNKTMPKQHVEGVGDVIGWKKHVISRHGLGTWDNLWDELGKGDWNRHDCDDGKTYLTKRVPGHKDKWWFAVIGSKVIDSARLVITGFSGDRGAILAPIDRDNCKPEWKIGHDFSTGS